MEKRATGVVLGHWTSDGRSFDADRGGDGGSAVCDNPWAFRSFEAGKVAFFKLLFNGIFARLIQKVVDFKNSLC
jgi:hypothetical protein